MDEKLWEDLYEKILEGDILKVLSFVLEYITKDDIFVNGSLKKICVTLLLLAVFAGVFSAFLDSFKGKETSKMSFLMINILMFSTLMTLYYEMFEITRGVLNSIVLLMNAAIPIYYVAVVSSGNYLSGYTYYRISILAIYVIEQVIVHVVLPWVSCYMVLSFGNAVWLEKKLSAITDFVKKMITTVLKALVSIVSGISFLQSMVSPMLDGLKNNAVGKVASMIPGIGNAAEGMTELTLGSLVLIKNSVGLCVFMLLFITAAVPLLKLFSVSLLLKGCGALMSIISEKNFVRPVMDTSTAITLLLKIVVAVLLLFVISMAIVAFTTNL